MGDTKVQGLARTREYNVYIDQDDKADKFTVRRKGHNPFYNPEDRTNFDWGVCAAAAFWISIPLFDFEHRFDPKHSLASARNNAASLCPLVPKGNSFKMANNTPLNKSIFKNANGEEFRAGSVVSIPEEKGLRKITGFRIAGFTDDPKRENIKNMSGLPDKTRKYAVIYALIEPARPLTGQSAPLSKIYEAPLNKLKAEPQISGDEKERVNSETHETLGFHLSGKEPAGIAPKWINLGIVPVVHQNLIFTPWTFFDSKPKLPPETLGSNEVVKIGDKNLGLFDKW